MYLTYNFIPFFIEKKDEERVEQKDGPVKGSHCKYQKKLQRVVQWPIHVGFKT
jgi:hypothetical protein